jgi:predicted nucleotidyltransferase
MAHAHVGFDEGCMYRTVAQGFANLQRNLEITDPQLARVSVRQRRLREVIGQKLEVLDSFLTGSYARHTMIAPLQKADVDVFVVLDPGYWEADGQAALLDRLRRVLKARYPLTTRISRNGQAVTISFSDFAVDVVPSFGWAERSYVIPDSIHGRWIETNPKLHEAAMARANRASGRMLVPLVKMLKAWNRKHSVTLRPFHLEVLALEILRGIPIADFPSAILHFMWKAQDQIGEVNPDPAGFGGDVGHYLTDPAKFEAANSRLSSAFIRVGRAIQLEQQGKIPAAYAQWRLVFGDYFPTGGYLLPAARPTPRPSTRW